MEKIRLRAIKFDVDFRKSEHTNYKIFKKSKKYPGDLKSGEAFLFVSKSGNQLIWIIYVGVTGIDIGTPKEIVDSRRWRIIGGQWNPLMLANYAEDVGVTLVGIKKFEELYAKTR